MILLSNTQEFSSPQVVFSDATCCVGRRSIGEDLREAVEGLGGGDYITFVRADLKSVRMEFRDLQFLHSFTALQMLTLSLGGLQIRQNGHKKYLTLGAGGKEQEDCSIGWYSLAPCSLLPFRGRGRKD